ncbi:MAG: sigma-70 family RNA polymerase sigma factor, partial [Planctomycetia bacterium]|nr:sigma-70 family RNA polymerase sigma factor [Planctomycetia bacterium]
MTSDRDTPNGSYCRPADWQLVEACIAGTPGGWDLFIRRFGRLISEVVSRTATRRQRGLSNTDHDDLVAEVFAELLARDAAALKMFSGRSTLTTYLTVIARRVTVRQLQRQLRLIVPA